MQANYNAEGADHNQIKTGRGKVFFHRAKLVVIKVEALHCSRET